MNSTGRIIAGVAAGVFAGLVIGVLFAPDKGSETREKLRKKGEEMAGDLKDAFEKAKEKFNDLKDDLERSV